MEMKHVGSIPQVSTCVLQAAKMLEHITNHSRNGQNSKSPKEFLHVRQQISIQTNMSNRIILPITQIKLVRQWKTSKFIGQTSCRSKGLPFDYFRAASQL